jgi:hypothetical protein
MSSNDGCGMRDVMSQPYNGLIRCRECKSRDGCVKHNATSVIVGDGVMVAAGARAECKTVASPEKSAKRSSACYST